MALVLTRKAMALQVMVMLHWVVIHVAYVVVKRVGVVVDDQPKA